MRTPTVKEKERENANEERARRRLGKRERYTNDSTVKKFYVPQQLLTAWSCEDAFLPLQQCRYGHTTLMPNPYIRLLIFRDTFPL